MSSTLNSPMQRTAPSQSWSKRLLTDVVAAMFKKSQPQSLDVSSGSRDSNAFTIRRVIHGDEKISEAEGQELRTQSDATATTWTDVSLEAVKYQDGPVNPMAQASEGGVEFTTLTWWQCGMCMVAETISLGILTLPKAVADLGLVAGIFVMVGMGLMASWTGYIIGQFKLRHADAHSMADAGRILFNKWGERICGWGALAFIVFIMGAHILSFRIMMDVLTDSRYCGVAWTALGLAISFVCCVPRTLKKMSYMSAASFVSILSAVIITIVNVGILHPGAKVINDQLIFEVRAWPKPGLGFHKYFNTICNIAFAYAGHVAFFTFISELRNPRDFNKSLAFLQISDISMYIITAVTIYVFAGENVGSPALNSARSLFKKIAFGVAVVTIIIAGVVNGHIACKYVYVRWLKDTPQVMGERSWKAWRIWLIINTVLWTIAWILAELVPVFMNFVGLTGAIFASWFTFGVPAMYYLHIHVGTDSWMDWKVVKYVWKYQSRREFALMVWAHFNLLVGAIICVVGVYSSIRSIMDAVGKESGRPFSCKHKL